MDEIKREIHIHIDAALMAQLRQGYVEEEPEDMIDITPQPMRPIGHVIAELEAARGADHGWGAACSRGSSVGAMIEPSEMVRRRIENGGTGGGTSLWDRQMQEGKVVYGVHGEVLFDSAFTPPPRPHAHDASCWSRCRVGIGHGAVNQLGPEEKKMPPSRMRDILGQDHRPDDRVAYITPDYKGLVTRRVALKHMNSAVVERLTPKSDALVPDEL